MGLCPFLVPREIFFCDLYHGILPVRVKRQGVLRQKEKMLSDFTHLAPKASQQARRRFCLSNKVNGLNRPLACFVKCLISCRIRVYAFCAYSKSRICLLTAFPTFRQFRTAIQHRIVSCALSRLHDPQEIMGAIVRYTHGLSKSDLGFSPLERRPVGFPSMACQRYLAGRDHPGTFPTVPIDPLGPIKGSIDLTP